MLISKVCISPHYIIATLFLFLQGESDVLDGGNQPDEHHEGEH